jgi:hypothetical protein
MKSRHKDKQDRKISCRGDDPATGPGRRGENVAVDDLAAHRTAFARWLDQKLRNRNLNDTSLAHRLRALGCRIHVDTVNRWTRFDGPVPPHVPRLKDPVLPLIAKALELSAEEDREMNMALEEAHLARGLEGQFSAARIGRLAAYFRTFRDQVPVFVPAFLLRRLQEKREDARPNALPCQTAPQRRGNGKDEDRGRSRARVSFPLNVSQGIASALTELFDNSSRARPSATWRTIGLWPGQIHARNAVVHPVSFEVRLHYRSLASTVRSQVFTIPAGLPPRARYHQNEPVVSLDPGMKIEWRDGLALNPEFFPRIHPRDRAQPEMRIEFRRPSVFGLSSLVAVYVSSDGVAPPPSHLPATRWQLSVPFVNSEHLDTWFKVKYGDYSRLYGRSLPRAIEKLILQAVVEPDDRRGTRHHFAADGASFRLGDIRELANVAAGTARIRALWSPSREPVPRAIECVVRRRGTSESLHVYEGLSLAQLRFLIAYCFRS